MPAGARFSAGVIHSSLLRTTTNSLINAVHALIMKIWPVSTKNKLRERSTALWRSNIIILSAHTSGSGLVMEWRMRCGSRPASASHSPPAKIPARGGGTQRSKFEWIQNEWRLLINCQNENYRRRSMFKDRKTQWNIRVNMVKGEKTYFYRINYKKIQHKNDFKSLQG